MAEDGKTAVIPAGAIRVLKSDFMRFFYRNSDSTVASGITFRFRMIADDGCTMDFNVNRGSAGTVTWADTALGSTSTQVTGDGWLVHVMATSTDGGFIQMPGQIFLRIEFLRSDGGSIPQVFAEIAKHNHESKWWEWHAGDPIESPFYGSPGSYIGTPAKLFTFQGSVANGAGGAGDQTLTITPPTGGRVEVVAILVVNNDTVARTTSIILDDGANTLIALGSVSLNAGAGLAAPQPGSTEAAAGNRANLHGVELAGSNRIVCTVAAVAASQDSAFSCLFRVYGSAPTMTLAGASTPTLTTNTSRFETG